jgi:uncharacterized protein YyaL (SSP411 family)
MSLNRLAAETSPYLRQHQDNPVEWWPWSAAALAEAKRRDRPILLSIGYAACHWCHVMAHESFEDEAIARVMNDNFINIKVDREERPDLDAVYQAALAMLGEHGGWPLTMFLTPQGEPFWGGTYFPPQARYGRPAFPDVLRQIATIYREQRDNLAKNVAALRDGLAKLAAPQPGKGLNLPLIEDVTRRAFGLIDPLHGGTAGAPKFPQPVFFRLIWRGHLRSGAPLLREAVTLTLDAMCQGGIYDHLGGGFARYATDVAWLVPHFEKMLYDNALVVDLMTEIWLTTRRPLYATRVRETLEWAQADLRVDAGDGETFAFASAFDADSEGEEGRYYVWSEQEVDAVLGADAGLFKAAYDVHPGGNWEGHTILNRRHPGGSRRTEAEEARLAAARGRLLAVRRRRVPPLRDDKVLADCNGLMIEALARAAVAFGEPSWLAAARSAFRFVCRHLQQGDRLLHSWCAGRAAHPGVLEDYANLARAAITLYEITGEPADLARARAWVDTLDRHHWDGGQGGYFVSADDTRDVIARTKSIADHAIPAGNGTMVEVLARLFFITGEAAYHARAETLATLFSGDNPQYLVGVPGLLTAYEWLARDVRQVVLVGAPDDPGLPALRQAALTSPQPLKVVQTLPPGPPLPAAHPAAGKPAVDGRATAYVCIGQSCGLPLQDASGLQAALVSA